MANRKISEFTALTAPASGDTFAILDVDASGAEVNKKITFANVLGKAPDGSAAAPAFSFSSDTNSGISGGSDTFVISTGGTAAISVDSSQNVTLSANLTVSGTTTTIDTTTLTVKDKNIEIAKGNGNDAAVDGAGITIDSTDGDKTWNWVDSTDAWTSSEHIHLGDSKKLLVGTGSDLQIYHDGTHNQLIASSGYIKLEATTNELYLRGNTVWIQSGDGNETFAKLIDNEAVELYYNNVKKFETTSYGNLSAGQVRVNSSNATTPAFSVGDSGTGFYNSGSNAIGYSANGTQKWNINSSGDLRLVDNVKANFGTGDDLQIYHNGSHSYLEESGTGNFYIRSSNTRMQSSAGEDQILLAENGAVELYYDGSKKLETASDKILFAAHAKVDTDDTYDLGASGARWKDLFISNDIDIKDNGKIILGDGDDLEIYSDGSTVFYLGNDQRFRNAAGDENFLTFTADGAVTAFYNGTKKFETTDVGVEATGHIFTTTKFRGNDDVKVSLGTSEDLQIWHDGSFSYIKDNNASSALIIEATNDTFIKHGGETCARFNNDGSVELYYDNVKRLETTSGGILVSGNVDAGTGNFLTDDNGKYYAGSGGDLEIWHNGSNSKINNTTGTLYIQGDVISLAGEGGSENLAVFNKDGAVELYYDNEKTFATTNDGIQVFNTNGYAKLKIQGNEGNGALVQFYADDADDDADNFRMGLFPSNNFAMQNYIDGAWEDCIKSTAAKAVELYYDNSKKLATYSGGVEVTGTLFIPDGSSSDNRISLGSGGDLKIYHTGSHSYIRNSTGDLYIQGNNSGTVTNNVICQSDGSTELHYDSSKKLATASDGITVYGRIAASRDETVATFNCDTSGDVLGISMRHGRGGLSGYTGKMIAFIGNDSTEEGSIVIGTTATLYNTSSDYRLKENQVAISDGITRLKTLKPYRFNFKKDTDTTVDGFFAHEVTPVVPEAIYGAKDATNSDGSINPQQIDQSKLVPLLTAALQEAITKIETLETKVAALEAA